MTLVGTKPAWTASRSFEPAPKSPFPVGLTPTTVTNADFNALAQQKSWTFTTKP